MNSALPTNDQIRHAITQWESAVYDDDADKLDKTRAELIEVLRRCCAGYAWTPVTDSRPPESFGVLAWITGGSLHLGEDYLDTAIYLNGIWRANVGLSDEPVQVSHWMYKPEPPERGT